MAVNIEIKARLRDHAGLLQRVEAISDTPVQMITQEDVFFHTPQGRLKLRILAPDLGQLIYYQRLDQDGPKRSDYHLHITDNPESLRAALSLAYGIRGVIRKRRCLYMVGQTRVHLDEVEGLGRFMELEVVLNPGETDAQGQAIAEELMRRLEIRSEDLIDGAYIDMLENCSSV
jgi:predicted adenylyl cyclase CyaB